MLVYTHLMGLNWGLAMRILCFLILALSFSIESYAQVHVKGYTRKDGTYVAPHIRSSPDAYKWNNYGPSSSSPNYLGKGHVTAPSTRDHDGDGVANMFDYDDDNDGTNDDFDSSQFGSASLWNSTNSIYPNSQSNGNSLSGNVLGRGTLVPGARAQVPAQQVSTQTNAVQKAIHQRNFTACKNGFYNCNSSILTSAELSVVKAAALSRNYQACNNGFYNCDVSKLTSNQTLVVKESLLQRNFTACKNGFYNCDTSKLSQDQKSVTLKASLDRNYAACKNGFYNCDTALLTQAEVGLMIVAGAVLGFMALQVIKSK